MLAAAARTQPLAAQPLPEQPLPEQPAASTDSVAANSSAPGTASAHEENARGQALFSGTVDLHGRIYTHVDDMPPEVVRCSNCHAVAEGPEVPRSAAPRLTPNLLLLPRARRGGPPSHYGRESFCALLRKGVDPAFVMISVQMPRYSIADADCRALWRYLTENAHEKIEH